MVVESVIEDSNLAEVWWTLKLVLLFIIVRLIVLGPYYRKRNRIDGKVVIITGCNSGIGKETALELAKRGGRIYMACRDYNRCEIARLEIIEESKNPNVFNRMLDLASLESIEKFVKKFLQEESRLDILINNAGVGEISKTYTKDGFEQNMGVNHLGHFYLTNLLLEILKKSAPSRIVVVSSILYFLGRIKRKDLHSEKSFSLFYGYPNSKLANFLFTFKLSKMLDGTGVTVNALHPGMVKTEIYRHLSSTTRCLLAPIFHCFYKTPRAGAQTSIRLAIDPDLEGVSGKSYFDCYLRFFLLPKGRSAGTAEWLWEKSEELVGLKNSRSYVKKCIQ